jgi:hypothetical protein
MVRYDSWSISIQSKKFVLFVIFMSIVEVM